MNEVARKAAGQLWRANLLVWAALMVLLGLTLYFAYVPIGRLQTPVALGIAAAKAALVAVLFIRETRLRTTPDKIEEPEIAMDLAAELEVGGALEARR